MVTNMSAQMAGPQLCGETTTPLVVSQVGHLDPVGLQKATEGLEKATTPLGAGKSLDKAAQKSLNKATGNGAPLTLAGTGSGGRVLRTEGN